MKKALDHVVLHRKRLLGESPTMLLELAREQGVLRTYKGMVRHATKELGQQTAMYEVTTTMTDLIGQTIVEQIPLSLRQEMLPRCAFRLTLDDRRPRDIQITSRTAPWVRTDRCRACVAGGRRAMVPIGHSFKRLAFSSHAFERIVQRVSADPYSYRRRLECQHNPWRPNHPCPYGERTLRLVGDMPRRARQRKPTPSSRLPATALPLASVLHI